MAAVAAALVPAVFAGETSLRGKNNTALAENRALAAQAPLIIKSGHECPSWETSCECEAVNAGFRLVAIPGFDEYRPFCLNSDYADSPGYQRQMWCENGRMPYVYHEAIGVKNFEYCICL